MAAHVAAGGNSGDVSKVELASFWQSAGVIKVKGGKSFPENDVREANFDEL